MKATISVLEMPTLSTVAVTPAGLRESIITFDDLIEAIRDFARPKERTPGAELRKAVT